MRVGGGVFEVPQARSEPPEAKRARELDEKRQQLRRAALEILGESGPLGRDPLLSEARHRGVKGRNAALRDWLTELAADPTSGLVSTSAGYALSLVQPPGPDDRGQSGATPAETPRPAGGQSPVGAPAAGQVWPATGEGSNGKKPHGAAAQTATREPPPVPAMVPADTGPGTGQGDSEPGPSRGGPAGDSTNNNRPSGGRTN
jgi:hypothetical protein